MEDVEFTKPDKGPLPKPHNAPPPGPPPPPPTPPKPDDGTGGNP
jgi:hypothetical protein